MSTRFRVSPANSPPLTLLQMLEQDVLSPPALIQEQGLPSCFWDEALLNPARTFFRSPGKGVRSSLMSLGWHLAGGKNAALLELSAILEALHGGSLIIDDIEDNSTRRRGQPALHVTYGVPMALNTANWLYFWALNLVQRLGLPTAIELQLYQVLSSTLLHGHSGQALDLSVRVTALEQTELPSVVAVISGLKTGRVMALAASLGAVAAGGSKILVDRLAEFGRQIGAALQMRDDLNNLSEKVDFAKRYEDLRNDRPSWVWAWLAEDMSKERFSLLQARNRDVVAGLDPAPLAEAMLRNLGTRGDECINQVLDLGFSDLYNHIGPQEPMEQFRLELARLRAALSAAQVCDATNLRHKDRHQN